MTLREYLDKHKLSVKDFAELSKIHPSSVWNYCNGNTPAKPKNREILKSMGITEFHFFPGIGMAELRESLIKYKAENRLTTLQLAKACDLNRSTILNVLHNSVINVEKTTARKIAQVTIPNFEKSANFSKRTYEQRGKNFDVENSDVVDVISFIAKEKRGVVYLPKKTLVNQAVEYLKDRNYKYEVSDDNGRYKIKFQK